MAPAYWITKPVGGSQLLSEGGAIADPLRSAQIDQNSAVLPDVIVVVAAVVEKLPLRDLIRVDISAGAGSRILHDRR